MYNYCFSTPSLCFVCVRALLKAEVCVLPKIFVLSSTRAIVFVIENYYTNIARETGHTAIQNLQSGLNARMPAGTTAKTSRRQKSKILVT